MKGLKKILISGLTSLLIGISSVSNAQDNQINPFVRPNVFSENYYGSGVYKFLVKIYWKYTLGYLFLSSFNKFKLASLTSDSITT